MFLKTAKIEGNYGVLPSAKLSIVICQLIGEKKLTNADILLFRTGNAPNMNLAKWNLLGWIPSVQSHVPHFTVIHERVTPVEQKPLQCQSVSITELQFVTSLYCRQGALHKYLYRCTKKCTSQQSISSFLLAQSNHRRPIFGTTQFITLHLRCSYQREQFKKFSRSAHL